MKRYILGLLMGLVPGFLHSTEPYTIADTPAWAKAEEVDTQKVIPVESISNGIYSLASHRHFRLDSAEEYGLYAWKILNETGVQNGSEITISFDPSYETITLHSVDVFRDGEWTPRLTPGLVEVLNREEDMEDFLVQGHLTLVMRLPDVRQGDIVRYDFTRKGRNPIMGGHFTTSFSTATTEPSGPQSIVFEGNGVEKLGIKSHGPGGSAPTRQSSGWLEWKTDEPPVVEVENSVPNHLTILPWVQVSDMKSWAEVVSWALPLYEDSSELPPDLLERISKFDGTDEEKTAAALRLVQDEIRYHGDARGVFAYKPRPASEVFTKKYGDCKEKTLLLKRILGAMGITSYPVLVNTDWYEGIGDWLPSPSTFDHVILEVLINGKSHFIDPTRNHQRGPLEQIFIPDYGLGLRVASGVENLQTIQSPPGSAGIIQVDEHFEIPEAGSEQPALLTVKTAARGWHAERMRATFQRNSTEQLGKDYRDFYARSHNLIKSLSPLKFTDDESANVFTVEERYELPEFWKPVQNRTYKGIVPAQELDSRLISPDHASRSWPLAIRHPENYEVTTRVSLPSDWPPPRIASKVSNPWFDFAYHVTGSGRLLIARGSYRSKASEVPADRVPDYHKDVQKASDALGFELTYNPRLKEMPPSEIHLMTLIGSAMLAFVAAVLLAVALLRFRGPDIPPLPSHAHLQGLGGWLILIGFGTVVAPFSMLGQLAGIYLPILQGTLATSLANPDNDHYIFWLLLLIITVGGNVVLLVFRAFLVPLFFMKKWIFPWVFIGTTLFNVAFLGFDGLASFLLQPNEESLASALAPVWGAALPAAIWVPYMLFSRRVKATFRK